MVALGFGVAWLGYQQIIYGWVLLKGWDVRWRDLANPLAPYQWPAGGNPPPIPAGQILPGGTSAPSSNASGGRGGPPPVLPPPSVYH